MGKVLCKHEDLNLIPNNQKKNMIWWLLLVVLVLGMETRGCLGLTDHFILAQ